MSSMCATPTQPRALLAIALLLVGDAAAAFSPSVVSMPAHGSKHAVSPAVQMVAVKEVFTAYREQAKPMQRTIGSMTPAVAQGTMAGVVAGAAAAGFLLTPSNRLAVNAVGGALSGSLGVVARNKIAKQRRDAAAIGVANLLSKGLNGVTSAELADVAQHHGVDKVTFQKQLAEMFLFYLSSCLNSHVIETSELAELKKLIELLRLTHAQAGMQVYAAARSLYSRHRAYIEDEGDNDSKRLLTKFIFLADRLTTLDDSEEGQRYEFSRLQKLFSLSDSEWKMRAENAAIPFYQQTLDLLMEGQPVSTAQLDAVRVSLGVSEARVEALHSAVYQRFARSTLQPEKETDAKLSEGDETKLSETAELLGLNKESADMCLLEMTSPLYMETVRTTLSELDTSDGSAPLEERQASLLTAQLGLREKELLLTPQAARDLERRVVREQATVLLEEAAKLLRAQNIGKATEAVKTLLGYCEKLDAFVAASAAARGEEQASGEGVFDRLAPEALKQSEVLSMYRVLLLSALEDLKVDEEEEVLLGRLRRVLDLSEEASTKVYEAAAGPLFRKLVEQATASEMGSEQKEELQRQISELALPDGVIAAIATEVYGSKLKEIAGDNKIINEEQSRSLAELREFLSLELEQVFDVHAEVCAGAYRNSVREVMGTTGRIPDEYWDGLARLQERLGLSESTAQSLYAEIAREKMKAFGQRAMEQLEEKLSGGASAAKDKGSDPFISSSSMGALGIDAGGGSLATEVLNLVDFAQNARILAQQEIEVEVDGKTETKEVEVIGASLKGEFSSKALKELYRQYLIEAFSGQQSSQNARLFNNLGRLSLVLGLDKDEVAAIHNELGSLIYRRYLARALQQGSLGDRERSFLDSIRGALDMEQSKCDELVREAEVNRVSDMVSSMFDRSQVNAEEVRKVRDTADSFEVSLLDDVAVSKNRLEKMFEVELEDLVTTGELTLNDMGALEEICEALHVSEERAAEMLQEAVTRRCTQGVLQAVALLRQGAEADMMEELKVVLKFAAIAPFEVALPAVSMDEKQEVYMLFQANSLTEGAPDEETKAELELLKTLVGLSQAPSPA